MDEKTLSAKREAEKDMMLEMTTIYCRGNHKDAKRNGKKLCPECAAFYEYATKRTDKCPFMSTKTFCNQCPVHCYNKTYRPVVKEVMKYGAPRMCLCEPVAFVKHFTTTMTSKQKLANEAKKQGITVEELKELNKKEALAQLKLANAAK